MFTEFIFGLCYAKRSLISWVVVIPKKGSFDMTWLFKKKKNSKHFSQIYLKSRCQKRKWLSQSDLWSSDLLSSPVIYGPVTYCPVWIMVHWLIVQSHLWSSDLLSSLNFGPVKDIQTDKAMHMSPLCISTGVLKNQTNLTFTLLSFFGVLARLLKSEASNGLNLVLHCNSFYLNLQ